MTKTEYITKAELNKIKSEYQIIICHASEYTKKDKEQFKSAKKTDINGLIG